MSSIATQGTIVENISEPYENKSPSVQLKTSNWTKLKAAHCRDLPRTSRGEVKLSNLINELQKFAIEEHEVAQKEEEIPMTNCWNCMRLFRRRLTQLLKQPTFHYIIILLVVTDLIVVLIDLVLGMFLLRTNELLYLLHLAQLSSPCLT